MTDAISSLAAISDSHGGFVIDNTQVRAPKHGEVRVRMAAAGVCHTDHQSLQWDGPLVLGHEGAGWIESIGPNVTDLAVGQPVLLNWAIPCGHCLPCQHAHGHLCDRTQGLSPESPSVDSPHTLWRHQAVRRSFNLGTFSQYTLVRASALTRLPEHLALDEACILGCGVMTGVGSAIQSAQVQHGDTVVVLGCGGVGLSVVQGARIAGASTIIALDKRIESLDRASSMGATHTWRITDDGDALEAAAAHVRILTQGRGADHAFEATGSHRLAFAPLKFIRHGGTALQLSGAHGEVSVAMPDFWWDKRYLTPLYGGCHPERDFPKLLRWIDEGQLDVASMVTRRYKLPQLQAAMNDMLSGRNIKGVIVFDQESA
ncbi:alcohol dehydrogenase catalytic domain-containing protein [Limnohabitans radicicola]|uniref:Alcohol dehydrogenase catalytic domain-containing protein n=1 Tax=Limnohabitans radicicola TaxID=2771427 RepID=A0A927IN84_9BURK|nr:alcohol dehydrogenase catalytic domain-containing protein [Limnohabitans radicicola]MBD8051951.1 alcohol dehydrogenase catalytic domain-containing protein [Limnohabitans radicicola]